MKLTRMITLVVVVLAVAATVVFFLWPPTPTPVKNFKPPGNIYPEAEFKDDATTNVQVAADALNLDFVDREGKPIRLADFRDKKNVVLVFMRGMTKEPGGVCPSCSAQTSRILANHAEFEKRETAVLVVFPGSKEHVAQYVAETQKREKQTSIPFSILFDEDFKAVDRLGIRADVAKPSTFVLDKEGQVRFAYVGATSADRPSLVAIYKQLDALTPAKK